MRNFEPVKAVTFLTNQAADGASAEHDVPYCDSSTFFIKLAGSAALTIKLQSKSPAGDWHTFYTLAPTGSSDGNLAPVVAASLLGAVRAVVSGWSVGNVSVSAYL